MISFRSLLLSSASPILRICWLLATLCVIAKPVSATPDPQSVLVLANSDSRGSMRVAKDYLRQRNIPQKNLIAIPMATSESVDRSAFISTILNPLIEHLIDASLIEAFDAGNDQIGRKRITILKNPFRYLVLCYEVPIHIREMENCPEDPDWIRSAFQGNSENSPQFETGPLAKNEASVDAELALMLKRDQPLRGFVPNPFFKNTSPTGISDILKVSRLDGPSARSAMNLVSSALRAEEFGLAGRAYVDEDGREGAYQKGNQWMANCASLFEKAGFDLTHDTKKQTFSTDSRFDAPVLYAGWYARHLDGPAAIERFRFPDGAVAAHLHSFSASPLRSDSKGWVGPLVHRGVAATFGNVAEPYLDFTHHFDAFFAALLNGWNIADAAYFAQPTLSWQNIVVGDPLYQPFKRSLAAQLELTGNPLRLLMEQYIFIRAINLKLAEGNVEDANKLVTRAMRSAPGPALALRKAQIEALNNSQTTAASLRLISQIQTYSADQWGLFAEIADTLLSLGYENDGVDIYRKIVHGSDSEVVIRSFLPRAIKAAQEAGQLDLSSKWFTQLQLLETPKTSDPSQ